MDHRFRQRSANDPSPPSRSWLFAQAIQGKPIPDPGQAARRARRDRELLEFAASISDRAREELRRIEAAEEQARHDRELLEWLAPMSEKHERELRALEEAEARQRETERYWQQLHEADARLTEWNEADHPRAPKGTSTGGQWVDKGGGKLNGATKPNSRNSRTPDGNAKSEATPRMLELAHAWWQTTNALEQARRDIRELPRRIASEQAQLGSGGRYAYIHSQNLAKAQRELQAARAVAPELEKQLAALEQEYRDSGFDETPYWAFTPGETLVGGTGIKDVGRAVARRGRPLGLQSTGLEFEVASTILAGPAVLRAGRALLAKALVRKKGASEALPLRPYGGAGGGHHVPAKSAFKGSSAYDAKTALAVPNEELAKRNVRHAAVTGAQKKLYREFAKTGEKLTWTEIERIETEALVRGGLDPGVARATVKEAIDSLKRAGVTEPSRIPWGN